MNVLLVYPKIATTYWGFQYSLPFGGKRASLPPLGLITVAGLLPPSWHLRLVDTNVTPLADCDLLWADVVLTGGMLLQIPGIHEVLARARALGRRTVVGGPAPTSVPQEFQDADIVFMGEVEGRIEQLVEALQATGGPHRVLAAKDETWPDLAQARVPRYDLLDLKSYASMAIQYSRGCPFRCEFCDIPEIYGRRPRVKSVEQVERELDFVHQLGFRGSLFFVDDNFIGDGRAVRHLLGAIERWQKVHGYPFELYTEASVNLASDARLVRAMIAAGFTAVFLGIETPSRDALRAAQKVQNLKLDCLEAVDYLTRAGLEVMGGFIVGFDTDGPEIFDQQRELLRRSPIPLAMMGLLTALPGTQLWRRMEAEGRLRESSDGDVFQRSNFTPVMDEVVLLEGYGSLLAELYSPQRYLERCIAYVERVGPTLTGGVHLTRSNAMAFLRAVWRIGILGERRREFWKLIGHALRHTPRAFRMAVVLAIRGEHLIRYTHEDVLPRLKKAIEQLKRDREKLPQAAASS